MTADELKEVVYQLKQNTFDKYCEEMSIDNIPNSQFYGDENNDFQISLDLLEHSKGEHQ